MKFVIVIVAAPQQPSVVLTRKIKSVFAVTETLLLLQLDILRFVTAPLLTYSPGSYEEPPESLVV